ncbi:MAG: HNH endonuclease [Bacteroidales bacterium]|nr:HNH endonuclease [Candidatus Latescibacterota bacterium]
MSEDRSRYISVHVAQELRNAARDRCSLQGHSIEPDEIRERIETNTLHMHHVVYFSEGGDNTSNNLMLVCPNCHAKIHRRPDLYPIETLRLAKWHWESMPKLLPEQIEDPTWQRSCNDQPCVRIPFVLETFNLRYELIVPGNAIIRQIADFVGNFVLRPAFAFSRTAPFPSILARAEFDRVELALQSDPDTFLPPDLLISELNVGEGDALIAASDVRMVHMLALEVEREKEEIELETVSLRWAAVPRDLDLHFDVEGEGRRARVWYRHLGTLKSFPWAKLSEDIRCGYGPEILSFGLLAKGVYTISVHNYSNEIPLRDSKAVIELNIRGESYQFECPYEGEGRWWLVCRIDVDRGEFDKINKITDSIEFHENDLM